ncbi:MAG: cysteine hydrolase [Candidatus Methanomethyliaceae archaeon]|nr:cysteine hydrolase [Candidatus Methanomethyliaceae archaeon]
MERPAIIVIDMLNDFVHGSLKCERALRIIPNIKKLIDFSREKGIPVIFSNDAHYPQDPEVVNRWGAHAIKGTKGAEVIPELKPSERDYVVDKRVYSGFFETGLDPLLRSLYRGEGVKTVILCGLHTHMCIRHTAADAFFRGYKIVVVKDGVEAFTEEDHISGLKYLVDAYNAKLMTVDEIIASLK